MHILPFVSIFIILLASLSYTFLDQGKTLSQEKRMMLSHLKLERALLCRVHKEAFKKAPKKKALSNKAPSMKVPSQKHSLPKSPRDRPLLKINLSPFLKSSQLPSELVVMLTATIKTLYAHTLFAKHPHLSIKTEHLVHTLIANGQKKISSLQKNNLSLESLSVVDLYPQTPVEEALFYKMLKGTHDYTLGVEGYPAFEQLFCLNSQAGYVFHFPSLSPKLLETLFGKEITEAILEKEESNSLAHPDEPFKTLSKEEFIALLNDKFPSESYTSCLEYFDFTRDPRPKVPLIAYDPQTHLFMEKKSL